jgi:purine-binding chemotaxis protein CheW
MLDTLNDAGADEAAADGDAATVSTALQFVTFHLGSEIVAVPLTDVQEIIRLPALVAVPLAVPSLKGLANLRGTVLPIVGLRRVFGLDDAIDDDASRVVVVNGARPYGFVVDRMANVVTAEPREIEALAGVSATVDDALLEGVIKQAQSMILLLNTAELTRALQSPASADTGSREIGNAAGNVAVVGEGRTDEIQLVSFELDGQEYALPIGAVQEIVQVPDDVVRVPRASDHVLGVITLRDRLLPLVCLRSLFGLTPAALDERSRIVVVAHAIDGRSHSVGLVTDTVTEVLRVPGGAIDALPQLLAAGGGFREIEQMCRLEGGKRLVSILLPDRLFGDRGLDSAIADAVNFKGDSDVPAHSETIGGVGDDDGQFVVFRIADEEYGVPIAEVQEIVRVPEAITHVPKAPAFVEGMINLRGVVLPVIDQRRRFALASIDRNDRQRIMVFLQNGVRTGFIVDSVSEVLKIAAGQISPAPAVATGRESAVAAVANITATKRIILMLEVNRLLSGPETTALDALAA